MQTGTKGSMAAVGAKLKRLRTDKGLKLREVSEAIGLSPGYLSQLENDRVGASFSTIMALAHFYDLNLADLLRSLGEENPPILSRPGQRAASMQGDRYIIEWLVSEPNLAMQVDVVTMEPGASSGGAYAHGGEEFAVVLEGTCTISVGLKEYPLQKGELLYFKSESPHAWRNDGTQQAQVLWCTTPPTV